MPGLLHTAGCVDQNLKDHTGGQFYTPPGVVQNQGTVLATTERALCHHLHNLIAKQFLFNWIHLSRLNNNNNNY